MITTPGIVWLFVAASHFITGLDEVVLDGQEGVIERGAAGARGPVELSHKRRGGTIDNLVRNGLQRLVLSHVLAHLFGIPALVFR